MGEARVELHRQPEVWYWVVIDPNGHQVLTSEMSDNKEDAEFQAQQEAEGREIEYVDTTAVTA